MRLYKHKRKQNGAEMEMIACLIVIGCALVYLGYETEWGTIRL